MVTIIAAAALSSLSCWSHRGEPIPDVLADALPAEPEHGISPVAAGQLGAGFGRNGNHARKLRLDQPGLRPVLTSIGLADGQGAADRGAQRRVRQLPRGTRFEACQRPLVDAEIAGSEPHGLSEQRQDVLDLFVRDGDQQFFAAFVSHGQQFGTLFHVGADRVVQVAGDNVSRNGSVHAQALALPLDFSEPLDERLPIAQRHLRLCGVVFVQRRAMQHVGLGQG